MSTDEDGAGQAGDYDEDDDDEEDEDGSEGGEVGLSFQVNRADQVGNSGFGLQVDPQPAQTQASPPPSHNAPVLSQAENRVCTKQNISI